jgi:DNA-binding MarR family transcriptional regulator
MPEGEERTREVAGMLRESIGNLTRRLTQTKSAGDLSWRESSALSLLARRGPRTAAELARLERISPQSMGATLKVLEDRGLVARSSDPGDGRRIVFDVTDAGRALRRQRVDARLAQWTDALAEDFSADELELLASASPLLDRLAQRTFEIGAKP